MSEGKGLGFYPGSPDKRDWQLKTFIDRMGAPQVKGSHFWYGRGALDQGSTSSCVGYSWTQRQNSSPKPANYDNAYAHALYKRAQELDEWEGVDYEGTSVRAGGLAAKEKGLISGFAYAATPEEAYVWLLNKGPIVIGIDWFSNFDNPTKANSYFIEAGGSYRGGHAIECDGLRLMRNSGDYVRVRNSWSEDWSYHGRAKIRLTLFEELVSARYAAMCTAVEV